MTTARKTPVISTVLLNWNRADLLDTTLASYLGTITVPFELFVVDNGSSDHSRGVIEKYCQQHDSIEPIFLDENLGGGALNLGLQKCTGQFFHVSENDLEYRQEWDRKLLGFFEAFPALGQVSLFGPVPDDDEVWVVKPSTLKHSRGRVIYEAQGNIGTSSLFRREIWDLGVRFKSIEGVGSFKFPNDFSFSNEIKSKGYVVAWADHNLVKNIGHSRNEFLTRPEYYKENYQSKSWLGETGLQQRVREWESAPKPTRKSFLFADERIAAEKTPPTPECPQPTLWSMFDGWTAELEVIEFIFSLARLTKPNFAVETGTWHGMAAAAIGVALRKNGRGRLVSLETDSESVQVATSRIDKLQLTKYVKVLNLSSLDYQPESEIDFLLLDSALEIRTQEFYAFLPHIKTGATIMFHDTSPHHKVVRQGIQILLDDGIVEGLFIDCPRGLGVFRLSTTKRSVRKSRFGGLTAIWRRFGKLL